MAGVGPDEHVRPAGLGRSDHEHAAHVPTARLAQPELLEVVPSTWTWPRPLVFAVPQPDAAVAAGGRWRSVDSRGRVGHRRRPAGSRASRPHARSGSASAVARQRIGITVDEQGAVARDAVARPGTRPGRSDSAPSVAGAAQDPPERDRPRSRVQPGLGVAGVRRRVADVVTEGVLALRQLGERALPLASMTPAPAHRRDEHCMSGHRASSATARRCPCPRRRRP